MTSILSLLAGLLAGIGGPVERAGYPDSGKLLAKLLYYGLMLIVLQLTVSVFGDSAVKQNKFLRLIVHLTIPDSPAQAVGGDRLRGDADRSHRQRRHDSQSERCERDPACRHIAVVGGVAANARLREEVSARADPVHRF